MGLRGRERVVREFAQERVIAETLAVYRELIPAADDRRESLSVGHHFE
jgi:hypothetical protein